LWHKNLTFDLLTDKITVFEGENIFLCDILTNGKILPLPWVHVSYTLPRSLVVKNDANIKYKQGERRNQLFFVGMKKTVTKKTSVLCVKRGFYEVTNCLMMCNNLLMNGYKTVNQDLRFGLLVYPRHTEFPESVFPFKKILGEILARRYINPDPFTFKGLREFQPFDSLRQINWKATARLGSPISNVYDFTITQEITILLNLEHYGKNNRDFVHEEAIRLAAYLCRQCIALGIPVSLVCPDKEGIPFQISGGSAGGHLESIYTALAYINLNKFILSAAQYLPIDSDKAWVLISSYHSGDILKKYRLLRQKKADIFWVIPHSPGDELTLAIGEGMLKWEVQNHYDVY
jgi:uncharacterized protein (DUF58 family)